MKKFMLTVLSLFMVLCTASCGSDKPVSSPAEATASPAALTPSPAPTMQNNIGNTANNANNMVNNTSNNAAQTNADGSLPYVYLGDSEGTAAIRTENGSKVYITNCDEWVSLRKSASVSSGVIAQIPLWQDVVFMADMQNGFCKVSYFNNVGYIPTEYLTAHVPQITSGKFRVINCNENISLRAAADGSAEVICLLPLGAEVDNCNYTARGGFYLVNYNGIYGWAASEYLQDISGNR